MGGAPHGRWVGLDSQDCFNQVTLWPGNWVFTPAYSAETCGFKFYLKQIVALRCLSWGCVCFVALSFVSLKDLNYRAPISVCPAHLWTPVELQTEILPHLALSNVPVRNPGTGEYCHLCGLDTLGHKNSLPYIHVHVRYI